jgi:hypothetical protein
MLIAADVLLAFGSVGAEAFFGWTLPPALADYVRHRTNQLPGLGDVIPIMLLLTTSASAFVAWIGLASFWRHARGVYLFSCATWILHLLVAGPSVKPSVAAVFTATNAVVGGMIIGLVYFSDLARRFETRRSEQPAPASGHFVPGRA